GRITGERVRNELTLLMREREPAQSLLVLQTRGILKAIHPAFVIGESIVEQFDRASSTPLFTPVEDITDLYWHIIALHIPLESLASFCERLMFGKTMSESMLAAARLNHDAESLVEPGLKPSQIVQKLEGIPDLALLTVRIGYENLFVQNRIQQYATEWRYVRPKTDGHTLR